MEETDNTLKNYRNEWKYCLSERDAQILYYRLEAVLEKDPHSSDNGRYRVSSLYFDDIRNTCAFENEAGERSRFKYRIRRYGTDYDHLFLERKEKLNSFCYKEKCSLTRDEYEDILDERYDRLVFSPDKPLLSRFCTDALCYYFRPKSIVNYYRTALIDDIYNIRITFDRNVTASYDYLNFLTGDYCEFPVLDKDRVVLEFKFDDVAPAYIRRILQSHSLTQQAFSKYYRSRSTLRNLGF